MPPCGESMYGLEAFAVLAYVGEGLLLIKRGTSPLLAMGVLVQGCLQNQSLGASTQMSSPCVSQSPGLSNWSSDIVADLP